VHRVRCAAQTTAVAAIVGLALSAAACGGPTISTGGSYVATTFVATALASSAAGKGTASGPAPDISGKNGPAAELLVLGTDATGGRGLWRLASPGMWSLLLSEPTATAVARLGDAVALAGPGYVREIAAGAYPRTTFLPLSLPAAGSDDNITALDRSPSGTLAIVTMGQRGSAYLLAGADGVVQRLNPAPVQPFAPDVAWLDDARLLVLSTDPAQASRLVEVNLEAASFSRSSTVAGVRDFAVSGDCATIAVATAGEILVGAVDDFLGSGQPFSVAAVSDGSVAWALALDWSGGRLALLEAAVTADGTATDSHVLIFVRAGASWTLQFDAPMPLTVISGEIWAGRS
jgi:hypothetical protein